MKQKNFLILCSDEHAPSALGCYGHPIVKTPVLDRLAARGTRFTSAYSPSPICVPARACLATGTHVHENRCWSSAEPYHGQMRSWAHDLRDQGHKVVSIGKLHYRSGEDDHGFNEEILPMYLANDGKGWPQALIRDPLPGFPEAQEMSKGVGPGETTYTNYDKEIAKLSSDWIGENAGDDPWTLFVSFVSPHYPLTAPEEFFDLYRDVDIPSPIENPEIQNHPVLSEIRKFWDYDDYFDAKTRDIAVRSYFGLCSFLDHNIDQVLKALKQSGQLEDTVIVYISDHGEMLGDHGLWAKSVMYEQSVGIPMILAGPGIPTGDNPTPVSLTDIAATARNIAGIAGPENTKQWQSINLMEIAANPDASRFVISEYHDGGCPTGMFMVRKGMWKYVYYAGDYPSQLFNLERDPDELADLAESDAHAITLKQMHEHLLEVIDPDEVNSAAFADQARLTETYGGREEILAMPSFNHTPIGS